MTHLTCEQLLQEASGLDLVGRDKGKLRHGPPQVVAHKVHVRVGAVALLVRHGALCKEQWCVCVCQPVTRGRVWGWLGFSLSCHGPSHPQPSLHKARHVATFDLHIYLGKNKITHEEVTPTTPTDDPFPGLSAYSFAHMSACPSHVGCTLISI